MATYLELDFQAIHRAAERNGVKDLYLFGSGATGKLRDNSDLDFLVDFMPDREDPFEDFCTLKEELGAITQREIDLVVKRAIRNPYFRESALKNAELVYAATI